jgi:hypothetical protein
MKTVHRLLSIIESSIEAPLPIGMIAPPRIHARSCGRPHQFELFDI